MPKLSDIALDAMLATQNLQSAGEGVHAGAHPDDTNTNTGASEVLTSDPVRSSLSCEMP